MLFNSYVFVLVFLPATVGLFYLARQVSPWLAKLVLISASLVFYGYWNVSYLPLLVGSILVNYAIAWTMARWHSAWLLALAVAGNLAVLGYFKYVDFFFGLGAELTGLEVLIGGTILPLGISFFTFQQIAYQVNGWRGLRRGEGPFTDYAVYVSFFPQLVAGPIVRDTEFMPQLARLRPRFDANLFTVGLLLFSIGLFKKVVIADSFAGIATPLFDRPAEVALLSLEQAWLAALAYTFQLYFDFSAYSDMAIGIAALFGIVLPVNFLAPYRAISPVDFWRRWHITLSRFFRDYLYIPLGGSRGSAARHALNLGIVMTLCGLWHGAGWTFVLWGALHGLALIVCHLAGRFGLAPHLDSPWRKAAGWALTFAFVVAGWVVFRALSLETAVDIWASMLGLGSAAASQPEVMFAFGREAAWAWVGLALVWVLALPTPYRWFFGTRAEGPNLDVGAIRLDLRAAAVCGLMLAAALLSLSRTTEFLYYNF